MHFPLPQIGTLRAARPAEAAAPRRPLRVRVAATAGQLLALASPWQRLHAEAHAASVFNGWDWQAAWWRLYGRGRPLQVLIATEQDRLVGLLPLYLDTATHFGLPVRILKFVGDGGDSHPDDLGPLLAPGREASVGHALGEAMLALPGFDVAQLNDIDSRSLFPAALASSAACAKLGCVAEADQRIAYLRLAGDWKAFLATLSGNRRSQLKRKRARLANEHGARFFLWRDGARLDEALERLAQLHRARWGALSESFATPEYLALHLATMRAAFARDELRLYCLEIDGAIAAMLYAYRLRDSIYVVQAGFDPALARFSPGAVLLHHALEHAIGEGNRVFDFLRGRHEYKERLATDWRQTVQVTVFRPTIGAAAFRARHVYVARAKAKVREMASSMSVFF